MSLDGALTLERGDFQLDCALNVPSRGVTAVFGRSGSGKTALLRCIAGLEPNARGRLRFGSSVWQSEGCFVPAEKRGACLVFQQPTLFTHQSVRDNLRFAQKRAPREGRRSIDHVAHAMGVGALLDRSAANLSGGESQRVAIARAVLSSPQLLLLDEPLSSLDEAGRAEVLPYLESLYRDLQIPIIYVTHSLGEVIRLADRLLLLERGKISAAGDLADLLTRLDLSLCQRDDAAAVLEGTLTQHEPRDGLSRFEFDGGALQIPLHEAQLNARVRVRINARDVSIALQPPALSSILNVITAQVIEIIPHVLAVQVVVKLRVGSQHVLARLTRRSVSALDLRPGMSVYAQMKSVAL